MYLPDIYDKFRQQYDEIAQKYDGLGQACRAAGPLEHKIQDLVKLGIAIGANSQGAVRSHTRKALASGATKEEIIHTVLLALTTMGFPSMIASMGWVREVLEKEASQ